MTYTCHVPGSVLGLEVENKIQLALNLVEEIKIIIFILENKLKSINKII